MNLNIFGKIFIVGGLVVSLSSVSYAKKKKKRNLGRSPVSIKEAMQRSQMDQERLRERVENSTEERMESFRGRETSAIEIDMSESQWKGGGRSAEPVSFRDEGEDYSGLQDLKSPVQEESVDINFDEELRDVNSLSN